MMLIKYCFPKCSGCWGTPIKTAARLWHYTARRYAGKGSAQEDYSRIPWHPERHTCIINVGSPINIVSKNTAHKACLPFKFSGFGKQLDLVMANNGHMVTLDVPEGAVQYSGGGMYDTFKLHHVHFHWGADSSSGSEHQIDNRRYAMEMHFVNYNAAYADLKAARSNTTGLSVLAFLFKVTMGTNQVLNPIVENLKKIREPYSAVSIQLSSLMSTLPNNLQDFYQYTEYSDNGLPTLVWTVFPKTIHISEAQIAQFRKLNSVDTFQGTKESVPLAANNRMHAHLPDMQVFRSFTTTPIKKDWRPQSVFGIKKKNRLLDE